MNLRITGMKCLDAIIGRMMASLLPPPVYGQNTGDPASILIIRPGGIGDAVLLFPMLIRLKAQYPDASLTLLAERRNVGVFTLYPHLKRILCYDKPSELLEALRGGYDCIIDTEQFHYLSAVLCRAITAPVTIGFDTNTRRRLFSHTVEYSHDQYEALSFFRLLKPLGIAPPERVPQRFLETSETDLPDEILKNRRPFIVLFPGASIRERQWGAERFHKLAEMLQPLGTDIIVIGGNAEKVVGEQILTGINGINLAGTTSIKQTAAIIDSCVLLVTADSGMLHLAVALDKPTVSLFGPGRHMKWAPQSNHHIVLNKKLSCSPCTTFGTTPPCPDNARCIQEISVDEVFNAVTILLTETGVLQRSCCKRDWIEVA